MHYSELDKAWAELSAPGQPFEITTIELRGVPVRTYVRAPRNVRELWLSTQRFADREYLVYEDERITYAQAHQMVAAIASWLTDQGVRYGDRVAIAMRNYPEWILVYWAGVSIGAAVVGMNAWWTATEMAYGFGDAAPKAVFADAERISRIAERPGILGDAKLVAVRADEAPAGAFAYADVLARRGELLDVAIDPDADACILYTSGTTGVPKGAQLTHRGCVTNLMNVMFASQVNALATQRATNLGTDPEQSPPPVALLTTPLFHVAANNCGAYSATAGGGTMVLMYRWDAGEALKLIERERVTVVNGVPATARELITHPDFHAYDTRSLMTLGGGGAQIQPDLVEKIERTLPAGRPTTGYGMTETCGIITSVTGDFLVDQPASCGRAMPTFETKVVDDEGRTLPLGQTGELWVRGASVIKGYINRPDATAESITDGWLHTGDMARINDRGFIYLVDRKKEMILRGGENVYCAEVEATLHQHAAIAECCVFGVPDARLGEEIGAVLVLRPGEIVTPARLREHCVSIAAKYKAPRYFWLLREALPRNASGKILKRELRDRLKVEDAADPA